jgi:hypothetical protein
MSNTALEKHALSSQGLAICLSIWHSQKCNDYAQHKATLTNASLFTNRGGSTTILECQRGHDNVHKRIVVHKQGWNFSRVDKWRWRWASQHSLDDRLAHVHLRTRVDDRLRRVSEVSIDCLAHVHLRTRVVDRLRRVSEVSTDFVDLLGGARMSSFFRVCLQERR